MIEYKTAPGNDDLFEKSRIVSVQNDGKLSLTQLWEFIVRTKRLPDGFDVNIFYNGVRERLRDPELEVRQHALRVLIDLIPVTQTTSLDDHMRALVPELLSNLGHPAPALRKGALDTLRNYLRHSRNYDELLKELITNTTVEDNVIAAAPFLISSSTTNKTLSYVIDQLWKEIHNKNYHQEISAKSLARIRYSLGDERFKMLIGAERFNDLQKVCDSYGLPIDYSDGDISDIENAMWEEEETIEDKVILETEITLRTGPAITMKIHEESRPGSVNNNSMGDNETETRQNMGVIKVLADDSESDYYEAARRTPRKVRFGGEQVKMRTPESDSSNHDESLSTIRITVTDAVSIKTRRSLIPVRITSLPSTPRKALPSSLVKPRLHKSTPNLSRSSSISRIPLKKGTNIKISAVPDTEAPKDSSKESPRSSENITLAVNPPHEPIVRRNSRADDDLSPTPVHNEIEVFHNLTRSPERQKKSTPSPQLDNDNEEVEDKKAITYNSFQVCPESCTEAEENLGKLSKEKCEVDAREELKPLNLHQSLQISSFSTEEELWNKPEALDNLLKMLNQPNTCETLEPGPAALLFEALFACQNVDKLHFLTDEALALLVKGLRQNVLEQCLGRVAHGICKVGAPSGVSLALMIMKKCPAKKLQMEIIDRCFAHRTREGALQCLMAAARLLPSKEVEVNKIAEFAASALRDRRRRVRHAALETLATLAQLTSNSDILDIVKRITETSQDHQYLLRVVRTRLSRRQLPSVEMDGTVRYSTPREQTEVEWLSGISVPSSPPSSSASSSTPSINYWKRNSRHVDGNALNLHLPSQDESTNGNQQIWAVDSSVFSKPNNIKESHKANGTILRPVYVLQPEAVRIGGIGHRRYDRGRSFSPPKPSRGPFQGVAASAPHNANLNAQQQFKQCEGFRKSFSSEQLYCIEKPHHEPYSFSLSSRSSTTSTGSSTRSGIWQKDIRSGIPVPISSETKLRLRTNNINNNNNVSLGPVIARRNGKVVDISLASKQSTPVLAITLPPETEEKSALGSTIQSPVVGRSPRENGSSTHVSIPPPPRSSGSESSGYFTPPPETHQAFVKLDTEEHASESEEIIHVNDDNNNTSDCVDSLNNNSPNMFITENAIQRTFSPSSVESSDPIDDKEEEKEVKSIEISESVTNNNLERDERRLLRFSSSSLKEPSFTGIMPPIIDNRTKSKSVVDLQNFLPDITASRKNVNSAPPLNDDMTDNITVSNIEDIPISPLKSLLPVTAEPEKEPVQKLESPKEGTSVRKLTKRFARTQSRRSIKSTPRSVRETTPQSSRPGSKPKEALQQSLAQLNSNEWEITIQGLQALGKMTRQHPETIEAQIHTVCVSLARHIKNLRSQVARSACHTASELFSTCKKGLDIELEEIAGPLLHRTADTNKFLRADANSALDVMCIQLPTSRVIAVVTGRGCTHQNSIVRAASMRLMNDIVSRLGTDKVFQMQKEMKDKILLAGANCLTDGSLEARNYAKAMFSHLISHPQFHRALVDAVPQSTLRHIAKTLNSIKPHPIT